MDALGEIGGNNSTLTTVKKHWQARTKRDLIIEVWEALDCESVGARELEQIQQALHEGLGAGAIESPAAIARVVADEGAALRHPEVFECDLKWRAGKVTAVADKLDFSALKSALESFGLVEIQRRGLEQTKDRAGLQQLSEVIAAARQDSLLLARSKVLAQQERAEAKEVSEWLRVWLVAPQLFRDWLELRMRSVEFRKRFGEAKRFRE
ncbi:MAG TPA: hypothetical protein DC047_05215 [Blastocatellia bacterium]|nr:hypothetical protein [Blastocatellia bacterium]